MKAWLTKVWHAFTAAVTSPTAVQQERSFATFVTVRILLAIGASASLVELARTVITG